jgi:hypothetical protein
LFRLSITPRSPLDHRGRVGAGRSHGFGPSQRGWVVAEAVLIEPVSDEFSLLTGKRTGNYVKIDLSGSML